MSFKMTQTHKFRDGKFQVYKQSNCKNWMARFYSEGKHKVISRKEESLREAKQVAIDWYDEIRYEQKHLGKPVHSIKFKQVVDDYFQYQKKFISGGDLSERQAKDYRIRLNGSLVYFNKMDIASIRLKQITEYIEYRLETVKRNH